MRQIFVSGLSVILLTGLAHAQAQTTPPEPVHLLGSQVASALDVVINREPLPQEFTLLLRTPAKIDAKDREAIIASLAKKLNAGLSPQLVVETLQADVHVPQKLHQTYPNDLTWDMAQLAKEMNKHAAAISSASPSDAAELARAGLLLCCYDDCTNAGFFGAVRMGLKDSSFSKLARLNGIQQKKMEAILTPLLHQSDIYMDMQLKLLETKLGPISEAKGVAISNSDAAAILTGLTETSEVVGEVTMSKYDFACMCADVFRLARIRKNDSLELEAKGFIEKIIASTKDETYKRWLRESEQAEAAETGPLLGHAILIKEPDGSVVPGTRTANGDVIKAK